MLIDFLLTHLGNLLLVSKQLTIVVVLLSQYLILSFEYLHLLIKFSHNLT